MHVGIFGAGPMRSLGQLCLAAKSFYVSSMKFPCGSRQGYTHFAAHKGLGGDLFFPGRNRQLCMFLVLNTPRHVYVFFWRDIAIVLCKKTDVTIWMFIFFQYLFLVMYVQPVFLGFRHFVRRPFEGYLVLVLHLRGTFSIWCTFRFLMRVLFSFPLFLTYAAGRCTLHATKSAEDGGQAFSSSSSFCIYMRFRLQLPSAGV